MTLVGCILVTIALAVGFLHSGRIQTAAVRLATEELSSGLNTVVRIGGVKYQFPMRITLNDIYIEDQQQDTLLYIQHLYTRFSPLALSEGRLTFPSIDLSYVRANVYRADDGEYNYMFLVRAFASNDTTSNPLKFDVQLRDVQVHDVVARYDSFVFRVPEAEMSLHHLSAGTVDAEIKRFGGSVSMQYATHEQFSRFSKDFVVSDIRAHLIANDTIITLPTLDMRLPNSRVDASGVTAIFPKKDIAASFGLYFRDNADLIRLCLHVDKARICPRDLKFFFRDLGNIDGTLAFSADLDGRLDSLSADNLELYYNDQRLFYGAFSAIGLPDMDELYVEAHCRDLALSVSPIQDMISDWQNRPFRLPPTLRRLGDVHYQGFLTGQLRNLLLKGAFRTALGTITTDGTMISNDDFTQMTISGKIGARRFNLGRLLANKDLGSVSMKLSTNWYLDTLTAPGGDADAAITNITYKGYEYTAVRLHCQFDDKFVQGALAIKDPNLKLDVNGVADFNNEDKYINGTVDLQRFCFGALHLSERYPDSEIRGTAQVRYLGPDINHADIRGSVDDVHVRVGRDSVAMSSLVLTSSRTDDVLSLKLNSDYLTAGAKGDFAYTTLHHSVLKQLAHYLPSIFSTERYERIVKSESDNNLAFYIYGHKLTELQELLQLPVMISDNPVIKGSFNERRNAWSLQGYVPALLAGNAEIHELTLTMDNNDDKASLAVALNMDSIDFHLYSKAFEDSLLLNLHVSALPPSPSYGNLDVHTHFLHYASKPLAEIHILPSVVQLGDSVYYFADSRIAYCVADTSLIVDNFRLIGRAQYIEAGGVASPRITDSLHISLGNINAGLLMPFALPEKAFTVGGQLTGWANLYGVFSKPVFEAEVRLDSAIMCGAHIGDAVASLSLDHETGDITIDGNVRNGEHLVAHVDGLAEPKKSHFVIDIFPDSIPLAFINHWTSGFLSDISGYGSGRVTVSGQGKKVWVVTKVKGMDAGLTIPFTGCRYTFNDSVFMDSTSIIFPNIQLRDEEGNPFLFDGKLTHDEYFRNFKLDLKGHCDHTLALNIPDAPGQFMQGKVYADGDLYIEGPDDDIVLTADAIAVGKSRMRISVDGASSAADNSFITFYNHNDKQPIVIEKHQNKSILPKRKQAAVSETRSRFRMGLNIDIDPQTLFQLVINERTGDVIEARGDGSIKFTMDDSTDEYRLVGTYSLLGGKMGFTLGNVIRREFKIAEGSQIMWNGDPEQPILNVTAKYQVTASLKDLFGSETENLISGRTSVPVITSVNLMGPLSDPIIRFGIELPNSEEAIASQVKSVINTDEMMMRQVVYLLVFGRFFTPEYLTASADGTGLNETYSLLSSTITGQINAWLGKLTNVFSMGFNIRSEGTGSDAAQEYEAVFQLQPIDRLIINGNFGYRYNDISNRPFFGDLDVEYLLTPNGKFRLKGYTHSVDKYSLKQATMVEGVGVVFKHDFNWKKE